MGIEQSIFLAGPAGAVVGGMAHFAWQEFRGRALPALELTASPKDEPRLYPTKRSTRERASYLASCTILSLVIGIAEALYWLGYSVPGDYPNMYKVGFWGLFSGFLIPQIYAAWEATAVRAIFSRVLGR